MFSDLNIWAVLVAGVASMIIGMLWYSPALFGSLWMKLVGLSPQRLEELKKQGMAGKAILGLLANIVMAAVLGLVLHAFGAQALALGLGVALVLWIGFSITHLLDSTLWEGKPWGLYVLNISHRLVTLLVMAAILVLWQ